MEALSLHPVELLAFWARSWKDATDNPPGQHPGVILKPPVRLFCLDMREGDILRSMEKVEFSQTYLLQEKAKEELWLWRRTKACVCLHIVWWPPQRTQHQQVPKTAEINLLQGWNWPSQNSTASRGTPLSPRDMSPAQTATHSSTAPRLLLERQGGLTLQAKWRL